MKRKATLIVFLVAMAQVQPPAGPMVQSGYHLTARPWKPLDIPRDRYLEAIEGICRFSIRHQNAEGAIIDPFLKREHQYATPYFAYAVGTLIDAGRAHDLLSHGVRAMEHATQCFGAGRDAIPDQHGEFFVAALTGALDLYARHVPAGVLNSWRERMQKPVAQVVRGNKNNWETYVMKGEWMRVLAGLAPRQSAVALIEEAWRERQRSRIAPAPWRLYHDRSSDPDTLSVEAVGRGNLLALAHLGYDGASAAEIRELAESGTRTTLWLQDPTGQVPANGRTDDHVWVDTGYQLAFEVMAERMSRQGDLWSAGKFRRAALLAFRSIARWRRNDGEWAGSYFVTKNHFDPRLRVGYQTASEYSNYNGSLMFHLSEAYHARKTEIAQHPAPTEIGGYAIATDPEFASVFANAGGMQMQANLRGQVGASSGNFWTPLGVVRFSAPDWDSRLGPSDGVLTAAGGITFAPTFCENGRWLRMADLSARYQGAWSVDFVHPLLVRCAVSYSPKPGQSGPAFRNEFILTPDAILSTVRKISPGDVPWGVTWPLLETGGTPAGDRQNFIPLDSGVRLEPDTTMRSSYGDLRAVRVTAPGTVNRALVYPSRPGDPDPEAVRGSFRLTGSGFTSVLGSVSGDTYVGRTAAGGFAGDLDLDGDGKPDVSFSQACGFMLQLKSGEVIAIEADRALGATIAGRRIKLAPHRPVTSRGTIR
jgi:hypothetical protein